jgi:hypothetical protein
MLAGNRGYENPSPPPPSGRRMPDPTSDDLHVRAYHGLPDIYVERLRIPGREADEMIDRWGRR